MLRLNYEILLLNLKPLLRRVFLLLFFLSVIPITSSAQRISESLYPDSAKADSIKLRFPQKDWPFLQLQRKITTLGLQQPSNIQREVEFDPISRQYVVREKIGNTLYRPPQYFSFDEYQKYENKLLKQSFWDQYSGSQLANSRTDRVIPTIFVQSEAFERIFGGNTIDIIPRGSADITFKGQKDKNQNPLFNERQRNQWGYDFDQRIQMNLTGQIGERLKLTTNFNTQAQFDFENQIRLDYTGKDDDIIKRIELGNVSLPLNTSLITGTEALFGIKTQLQFGRLHFTGILSQQRSQQREILIRNGSQESEFALKADDYEENQHFFLGQYFRENFNRFLAMAPVINSGINITQIEVWISNRSNAIEGSRDVLALLDLAESKPYNTQVIAPGGSQLPSSGIPGEPGSPVSNNLLSALPADARLTQSSSIQTFFEGSGRNDNYSKLTYARRLNEGTDFTINRQLGFISLRMPIQGDQVLAVSYKYTANGREYQVGEFSTDIPVTPSEPQMLYVKMLRSEVLKTYLPTWDLMMKNIYSIGAYNVGPQNFNFQIYRIEDESGVERPIMTEGENTQNKLWIQLTGLDRLNPQLARQTDGFFDYLPGITIDKEFGKVMFPVVEPFGEDLARQFIPGAEDALIEKYTYYALYDSTKTLAQQLFPNKNRFLIKGTYESEMGTEFQLGAINVPVGSVQVFAGNTPLQEGADYMVDYYIGRVRILNQALLQSGQPLRIKLENSQLYGVQQRTLMGGRFDYLASDKLTLGGTILSLNERPLTQKVMIGEEPISNTMWGLDLNYNSSSQWLTRLVDKIPFIDTKEESQISFYSEFAQLRPGVAKALNFAGSTSGTIYLDDFENAKSFIDLKGARAWQIAGTPQLFPESQSSNDLSYGYNRAKLAFYNIDPIFYRNISLTPPNITNQELSDHRVRAVMDREVFPLKDSPTGMPMFLSTMDLAYFPMLRGPYNYRTTGLGPDGNLIDPQTKWGGIFRKIEVPDFESQNIEFIEMWMMDPFLTNPQSEGGDLYFNLGNVSEDILKDGRKALENGNSDNLADMDETVWGRVPKRQPVVNVFDNDPVKRARQDIGLDGLSDDDERIFHNDFISQLRAILNPASVQVLENDPSSDNFTYYRGVQLDQENAGILKRYENFNGLEGNARTPEQSQEDFGVGTSASTLYPDGEDIDRDNNMNEVEEYYQYKVALRKNEMEIGQNYITDIQESEVKLPNGRTEKVKWYQFRVPIANGEAVGQIRDFKSIRFMRMFLTNFQDTAVLRLAQLQLIKGEWRRYNAENTVAKVIADPALGQVGLDNSSLLVSTVNIEENANRRPVPYVVPPGIQRQLEWGTSQNNIQMNEQSLSMEIRNLRDGYGRAAYKTTTSDFRSYGRIELFVHAERSPDNQILDDGALNAFVRLGTDDRYNYYQYELPLKVTPPGTADPELIWPEENRMNIPISIFQRAKEARNKATQNGAPWPIDVPYIYIEAGHKVTILGQPDISKVRFYMLGALNPLKGGLGGGAQDDGLEKSGTIWFNELRLTDFDREGGWAATARLHAKLADFANISVSGRKSTIGFGTLDQRLSNRNRSEDLYFDIISNAELGKFFPVSAGIRVPFYFSYTNQQSTPEYNPLMPDMELNSALANLGRNQRDSLLRVTQEYMTRKSFNFTNVRKIRTNMDRRSRPWNIENFSGTYSFSENYQRDHLTELALQQNHRAALDYTFTSDGLRFIEPLKNRIKSNYLDLFREFNFNLMPSLLNFRIDVNRTYNENTLRANSPDNFIPVVGTMYNKNFVMNRLYGISWNLTKALKLDFNATNYAIIDEPDGKLDAFKRDTLWSNFWKLGRTTDYNHMLNLTYSLPVHLLPGLDWITVDTRYGAQFHWQAEPLFSMNSADMSLGNSVQNGRTIQVNPRLSFNNLYNKFGFVRRGSGPDASGISSFLVGLLTSVKDVNAAYTRTDNTFLPGYLPKSNALGMDFDMSAPGWGFVFGSQRDIRQRAASAGWITTDSLQNQLYTRAKTEDISVRAMVEPIRSLQIDVTALRNKNLNFNSLFRYNPANQSFESVTPYESGMFTISTVTIGTSFRDPDALYRSFERNKRQISSRLGALNPNSAGADAEGFATGYGKESQEVVLNAFLATYSGYDPESRTLRTFPKIPLPNWRMTYSGLSGLQIFEDFLSSITLSHAYSNQYSINGFNTTSRYGELNGASAVTDVKGDFLPKYQFQQVSIFEQFVPLLGVDTRFKNGLTASSEYRKSRTLMLSLQNSQLSLQQDEAIVVGMGYRTNSFQFPFGWFSQLKLNNDLNFRFDFALNDTKTVVYRSESNEAEISAGTKTISIRPSVDYMINQRFNIRLFYDSNAIKPYTSQTFANSYMNFGFNLRVMLQ